VLNHKECGSKPSARIGQLPLQHTSLVPNQANWNQPAGVDALQGCFQGGQLLFFLINLNLTSS